MKFLLATRSRLGLMSSGSCKLRLSQPRWLLRRFSIVLMFCWREPAHRVTLWRLAKHISSKCGTRRNTWKSISWDKLERSCSTRSGQQVGDARGVPKGGCEGGVEGGGLRERERGRQVHRTANYISEGKNEQCIKTWKKSVGARAYTCESGKTRWGGRKREKRAAAERN